MKKSCHVFAWIAFAVALAMFFCAAFLFFEADHDCTGADCAVCAQLSICKNVLCCLLIAAFTDSFFFGIAFSRCRFLRTPSVARRTLVSLKIKLSN